MARSCQQQGNNEKRHKGDLVLGEGNWRSMKSITNFKASLTRDLKYFALIPC